jgi:hypothetical protein
MEAEGKQSAAEAWPDQIVCIAAEIYSVAETNAVVRSLVLTAHLLLS